MARSDRGIGASDGARDDVAIVDHGRRVLLKWHKLRRMASEPPFNPANLAAGLAVGASMEVDVRRLSDGAWICLHDAILDGETSGSGPVSSLDTVGARALRIGGADYPPPMLADLAAVVGSAAPSVACLQLDLKEPVAGIDAGAIDAFATAVGDAAPLCLLSGHDWAGLKRLGAAMPGLRLGYDPYEVAAGRTLRDASDFARFADETLERASGAGAFYLHHRFVDAALAVGVNPIAILQAGGALIDVWTLDPTTPDIAAILRRMIAAGADQITTNAPGALARLWRDRAP